MLGQAFDACADEQVQLLLRIQEIALCLELALRLALTHGIPECYPVFFHLFN